METILPLAFSGTSGGRQNQSLSKECLRRLKHAIDIMHQIDLAAARELQACKQIESLGIKSGRGEGPKLLTAEEKQQFEAFCLNVAKQRQIIKTIQTEAEIRTYLRNMGEDVSELQLASTVTSRIQNRYVLVDGMIAVWDECRLRAQIFLDLGSSIIHHLQPIKFVLQEHADEVLFAIRMKLNAIKAYDIIFDHQHTERRDNDRLIPKHRFVSLLQEFDLDDTLPKNVADAYPANDNSLRAVLSATTLVVIIGCVVPIVMAWQRSSTKVGSRSDPDFFVALQTALMQLLNLFTMMFPVSRFTPVLAWRLAWAFTIAAGLFSIATPLLYVIVPVKWSFLASYMASASQAAVLLEIMLSSRFSRSKFA